MKHFTQKLACGAVSAVMLMSSVFAAPSIAPSQTEIQLPEHTNTFSFDIRLTAEEAFAGAEFGLQPSSDAISMEIEYLDVKGASEASAKRNGVYYFGFFKATNAYEADKEYTVGRVTCTYSGQEDQTITMVKSNVVTVNTEDKTTTGDDTAAPFTVSIHRESEGSSGTVTRHTITVNQAQGGTITPATCQVTAGASKTFTITPNSGYAIQEVLVDGKSVGAVSTYTFQNVRSSHTITAKFTANGQGGGTAQDDLPYIDVHSTDWFVDAVRYVTNQKLMGGVSTNLFAPNSPMTRAMFVTVLARMEGVDTSKGSTWYEAGRTWAMENGVSDGTNMEGSITREQLATMLYRYAGSPAVSGTITGFADAAAVSDWAVNGVKWAVDQGIINGSDGKLLPQGNATRAQVAAMLMRFLQNKA